MWLVRVNPQFCVTRPHDKPQCIVVGTYGPHFPYVAPPELFFNYLDKARVPVTFDGEEDFINPILRALQARRVREEVVLACQAAYRGMVEHMDGLIGRVRSAFDSFVQGRGAQSLFAYLSDHGDTIGEHGIFGKKLFLKNR